MGKNVNINITKKETQFIDGSTGKRLTKEEFAERYGKVRPNLQAKDTSGDDDEDRGDKKTGGVEKGKGETS